ncbi:uncharacterized protein LOC143732356 isoform X2 [Siphateles boraxobius]|uniref:uncharacterized protein LOC143732356 isoform X2 n=1 Tax=Siphateles boraxobius TaxID=180520 RepID=UPI004064C4E6
MLHIYFLMFHLVYFSMSIEEQRWIKIPCHANIEQGVKYRRITWYKVKESSDVLAGLVSKDLLKNITRLFKFAHHSYEVGEDNSLVVPGTAEEDCGVYRCTLWPPLGHYIQEGNTDYYSADCIKPQVQAVSSKKDTLSANHQFIIVGCVLSLVSCAVIMFLNLKLIKKNNIMKKLVQTDERI